MRVAQAAAAMSPSAYAFRAVRPFALAALMSAEACDTPTTSVVFENNHPPESSVVVYDAFWQAVPLPAALLPGSASSPQPTVPASANTAYAVLAPGWDPTGSSRPESLIPVESRSGFSVDLNATVAIPIEAATFAGDCVTGSFLTQDQADFLTQIVFQNDFAGLRYDAATCVSTPAP